jgi:hypothetical protein
MGRPGGEILAGGRGDDDDRHVARAMIVAQYLAQLQAGDEPELRIRDEQ